MKSVADLLRLDDRVCVITGGAGHIGLAAGEAFAELGGRVVIVDLTEAACVARSDDLSRRFGVETHPLPFDLAQPGAGGEIVRATLARFGRLDVLVNNAALTGMSGVPGYAVPWAEQSLAAWDAALRINLSAAFELTHAATDALGAHSGSVINVGSIYGVVGPNLGLYEGTVMGNPAAYAATKGALIQLTRYLAAVMAPRVRVNTLSPGGIERGQPEAFQARYRDRTPLRRMGTEEDLKGAFAFLAGDAAAYVTGQNLVVDGGWTAW
jgi:NAD(P)-dependent dehydrogenase (short-subunit alcohol dehydrogenase family)